MTTLPHTGRASVVSGLAIVAMLSSLGAGCGRVSFRLGDAGVLDAGAVAPDAGVDASARLDGGLDAQTPPSPDAAVPDAGVAPMLDAGADAGAVPDRGVDAGALRDGGVDAGVGRDLLLWLELDDDPTDGAQDSSSYLRNAACGTTCPTLTADRHGTVRAAFAFDGASTLVVPGGAELASTTALTVAFWIERSAGVNMVALGKALTTGFSWQVLVRDVGVSLMVPGASIDFSGGPTPPVGWAHLAFTWDGATFRLYRDGVAAGTASATTTFDPRNLFIGTGPGGLPFTGSLDDLRVYDRALTPAEIAALAAP